MGIKSTLRTIGLYFGYKPTQSKSHWKRLTNIPDSSDYIERDQSMSATPSLAPTQTPAIDAPRATSSQNPGDATSRAVVPYQSHAVAAFDAAGSDPARLQLPIPPFTDALVSKHFLAKIDDRAARQLLGKPLNKLSDNDVRRWLQEVGTPSSKARSELVELLEKGPQGSIFHCSVGEHSASVSLWGAAMLLAGYYGASKTFSFLLTLKNSDEVVHLGRHFGGSYFSRQTMAYAVASCARKMWKKDIKDRKNIALCAHDLLVAAMRDDFRGRDLGTNPDGVWGQEWGVIFQGFADVINASPDRSNERFRREGEILQVMATFTTIAQVALEDYERSFDKARGNQRQAAETAVALGIVGLSVGLATIAHCPPAAIAAIPAIDVAKKKLIDRVLPKREREKISRALDVQGQMDIQTAPVNRLPSGAAPSPGTSIEMSHFVGIWDRAVRASRALTQS